MIKNTKKKDLIANKLNLFKKLEKFKGHLVEKKEKNIKKQRRLIKSNKSLNQRKHVREEKLSKTKHVKTEFRLETLNLIYR